MSHDNTGLQLELQIRVLNNLLEIAKREDVIIFATIQRIQKESIKVLSENIIIKHKQPLEKFGRFWYFLTIYSLKGNSYTSITEKAFKKARENKDNSVEIETSINSATNSRLASKKSSRRSSKASKMPKSNILVNTSSHDQSLPPKNNNNDPFQNPSENELKWLNLSRSDKAVKNYSGNRLEIHEELANQRSNNIEDKRRRNNTPPLPSDTGNELLNQLLLGFTNVLNTHTEYVKEFHKNDFEYEENQEYINELLKNDELIEYWHVFQGNVTLCLIYNFDDVDYHSHMITKKKIQKLQQILKQHAKNGDIKMFCYKCQKKDHHQQDCLFTFCSRCHKWIDYNYHKCLSNDSINIFQLIKKSKTPTYVMNLIYNDAGEEWKLQDAYFAEAEVFEKRINVMINTGAVRCIITKRFLDLVNKEIEASTKNNEKYSFCQKLYEDLEDYRVAKAQIEEDDELIEITKGKDTSIRSLTNIQRMQLQQLLTKNKDLFANNKSELTQTNVAQHSI
ncbi:17013_t:CDS:2, partial [Funneliformis geosporum]